MNITIISKNEFLTLVYNNKEEFLFRINSPEIFIVKHFIDKEICINLRNSSFLWGNIEASSWHKFDDNCPDYHRLHDNYPKAHVKQKFHGFYRHNYFEKNQQLFNDFSEVFLIKNFLAGYQENEFMNNKPSDGTLPRINVHHYPTGGGYQAEHIDPNGPHAQIQNLIVASSFNVDYSQGGVFARANILSEKQYIDQFTEIGDMIVMSPGIPHGVDPIDPDSFYSSHLNTGRWIILPLFLQSDVIEVNNIKPKQI